MTDYCALYLCSLCKLYYRSDASFRIDRGNAVTHVYDLTQNNKPINPFTCSK